MGTKNRGNTVKNQNTYHIRLRYPKDGSIDLVPFS